MHMVTHLFHSILIEVETNITIVAYNNISRACHRIDHTHSTNILQKDMYMYNQKWQLH